MCNKCVKCGKELKSGQKIFCSRSCANSYNNMKKSYDWCHRTKTVICTECGKEIEIKLNASASTALCDECKLKKYPQTKNRKNKSNGSITKRCVVCNKKFAAAKSQIYCSDECSIKDVGLTRKDIRENNRYEHYKNNQDLYKNGAYNPPWLKNRIIKEQNNKCDICGITDTWNGKHLVLQLDHIDGDSSNNKRENLRCICPNCHSQTETFCKKSQTSQRYTYIINRLAKTISEGFID